MQENKAHNIRESVALLELCKIPFVTTNEIHYIITTHEGIIIDFWPSTGKYIYRTTKKIGRGVFNLLKEIDK